MPVSTKPIDSQSPNKSHTVRWLDKKALTYSKLANRAPIDTPQSVIYCTTVPQYKVPQYTNHHQSYTVLQGHSTKCHSTHTAISHILYYSAPVHTPPSVLYCTTVPYTTYPLVMSTYHPYLSTHYIYMPTCYVYLLCPLVNSLCLHVHLLCLLIIPTCLLIMSACHA